ncbi:MAG: hypothetical protein LUD07_02525 [Clostridiales bacterium]|nr:hypothetical protein [Clostridiales bacterium]
MFKNSEVSLDDIIKGNEPEKEAGGLEESDYELEKEVDGSEESDYEPEEEVYFAFIDVLGFKKTFDDIRLSDKNDEVNKFKDIFKYYFDLMGEAKFMEGGGREWCYAGQTSDSLYFYTRRPDFLL